MKKILLFQLKRNRKFILIALVFLIWMLFFDNRNVFVQKSLDKQISQLEKEYANYHEKLIKVQAEYYAMKRYPEKYAREKYFMHKPSEVVFIYQD